MISPSKYNIFSQISDSEKYFIVNLLSKQADILQPSEYDSFKDALEGKKINSVLFNEFIEKGYFVDEQEERKTYRRKYLDFIDNRDHDEVQLFFVPNYSCNFACAYCYQDQYLSDSGTISNEVIDAFFDYITTEFLSRRKYITVFGGEPLLGSPAQKKTISYIITKANEAGLDISFVTNGYSLLEYIDIFSLANIREIQVTLDGTEDIHNKRRFLKDGSPTFQKIVDGIDICLKNKININLRLVADKENIDNLPEFARFAIDKGWTKSSYFKTQIGRNYELHHCQSSPDKLFSRLSLYRKIYDLIQDHPHIEEFYKPAYSISKFLWETGDLPDALFDSCPACKTEWAFDYTGKIFSCTATVGKKNELLGTFYPQVTKSKDIINQWEIRDVTSIPKCSNCNLQLACGGGCGSIAKNNSGNICSADCRPVKELMELGFSRYFDSKFNHFNLHGLKFIDINN
jgi:uncharacterized protein